MATHATARETLSALRREIARIEGRLAETLAMPTAEGAAAMAAGPYSGRPAGLPSLIGTGARCFDRALGGGLPLAALTEIHGRETRDVGAVAGFALALASLMLGDGLAGPLLWIGTAALFHEAGLPYAAGLLARFGIAPGSLLLVEARKTGDALWAAEEAARLNALSAVFLEIRGNPARLDLTATRRLNRRAQAAGRPVFLLRQAAEAEPTAAPVRLVVSPAPAASRRTLAGPLAGSIGPPAFAVAIDKSRNAFSGKFTLEWNPDERSFIDRDNGAESGGAMVPASGLGPDLPTAVRPLVALGRPDIRPASRHQPARGQYRADRRSRRAG